MLSPAARKHRADLAELARLAEGDMSVLFRNVGNADRVREALRDTLPQLVTVYGSAAASLGADWYDEMRDRAAVKGRFQAIVADLPDVGRTDALAGWAIGPLFGATPDAAAAQGMASGGLQRIIFNADRFTVTGSATQDRRAGWVREGNGDCGWCQQYLDGVVHYVEGYDFDAHDNCKCTAVPVFEGDTTSSTGRSVASGQEENALDRTTGAQTAARAVSAKAQLASYEKVLANGGGTDWMRAQVVSLRKELAALKVK